MPLRDHFHPPLSLRRHFHAFHNAWATFIASELNRQLPDGYFAEPNVQFGIEIDVAAFDEGLSDGSPVLTGWTPPEPVATIPLTLIGDVVEVNVFQTEDGPILIGTVEIVSPSNKDRAEEREALVTKCASYLQAGLGLVLIDAVTSRRGNLHAELLQRVSATQEAYGESDLYASAYHPVKVDEDVRLTIWHEPLSIGRALPTLPLWLRGGPCLRLDLEACYERTCLEQKMSVAG